MTTLSNKIERNHSIDLIKGFAICLVVLGHILSATVSGAENSLLNNIIWVLQIPLFMVVGGFVTKYSRKISDGKTFLQYIGKRSLAYLLPWVVWTILIRGIIWGQGFMLDIKGLLFNMDSGYWFLFSLWCISLIFAVAEFIGSKLVKTEYNVWRVFIVCIVSVIIGGILLGGIILLVSPKFLGAKLTLYYLPFFLMGYIIGRMQSLVGTDAKRKLILKDIVAILAALGFFALINRYNFYTMGEDISSIALRIAASVTGSIMICCIFESLKNLNNKFIKVLAFLGCHSLEIYLIHNLFLLIIIKMPIAPIANSLNAFWLVLVNFLITILGAALSTYLLNQNKAAKFILFGKRQ